MGMACPEAPEEIAGYTPDAFRFVLAVNPDRAWEILLEVEPSRGRAALESVGIWGANLPRVSWPQARHLWHDQNAWLEMSEKCPPGEEPAMACWCAAVGDAFRVNHGFARRIRMVLRFVAARAQATGEWPDPWARGVRTILAQFPERGPLDTYLHEVSKLGLPGETQVRINAWLTRVFVFFADRGGRA